MPMFTSWKLKKLSGKIEREVNNMDNLTAKKKLQLISDCINSEGSVGLVIERKRAGKGFNDGLLWFCDNCNHKLHEVYFELHDIEKDFLPHFSTFYNSEEKRTCKKCGTVMETNPKFTKKSHKVSQRFSQSFAKKSVKICEIRGKI